MNEQQMSALVQDVIDGKESAIKAFAVLKRVIDHATACIETIKPEAVEESKDYETNFSLHGFKFEKRKGGKYYDFSSIQTWQKKNDELKSLEEKYKSAYSNYEKGLQSVTEDGEVVELPVVKYRPDVLIVKK